MRWYQGGIAEAVATAKTRNALFVVFVEGTDDASKSNAATLNSEEVSSVLDTDDFISVRIESSSEAYRQFMQIYHLVPIPSLFFIGTNGAPLEVVAGEMNARDLLTRIRAVLSKTGKKMQQEEEVSVEKVEEPVKAKQAENDVLRSSPEGAESSEPSAPVEEKATASTAPSTLDERVEHAKELLEKKRKEKQEEEEQKERMKELERRKSGQDVQKLRRWQQEQELQQLKEERRREKMEEAAAKERILKQIAQDRAERAARFSQEKEEAKKQVDEENKKLAEQKAQEAAARSDIGRIQFRLPDGSSHTHSFDAGATLAEVQSFVQSNLNLPFREFLMSTSFPRREFGPSECSQTIRDLQLVPTAVILILPSSSGAVVTSSNQHSYMDFLSRFVWSFLTPFVSVFSYVRSLIFGGAVGSSSRGNNSSSSSSSSNSRETSHDSSADGDDKQRDSRRHLADSTVFRRQGNIHRLTNRHDSSDDENNTWNGNSTQQM